MIEYTINGQRISEEDIKRMQAQFEQQQEQMEQAVKAEKERIEKEFDCGYCLIQSSQIGGKLFDVGCGLTKELIPHFTICKNCASYNNHIFEVIENDC